MASNTGDSVNDESNKNKQVVDDDLDSLLDDALADFDKLSNTQKEKEKEIKNKAHKLSLNTTEMPLDDHSDESMFNEVYEKVLKMMSVESNDDAAKGASSIPELNGSVNETIQRALNSLNKDLDNIEGSGDMSQEMMDLLSKMNLGDEDSDITPLVQDMMSNLLSKDVLYPSLKDIADKYPQWLSENEKKLEAKELARYRDQHRLVERIVREYEAESAGDSEKTKRERFERILDHMQNMQQLGHPPKEILGDASKDLAFGDGGFLPKMTDSGLDPNQCSLS